MIAYATTIAPSVRALLPPNGPDVSRYALQGSVRKISDVHFIPIARDQRTPHFYPGAELSESSLQPPKT
jgi:hypothetical protein